MRRTWIDVTALSQFLAQSSSIMGIIQDLKGYMRVEELSIPDIASEAY